MNNAIQETFEDIVDDIRAQNQGLPEDSYALSPLVADLLRIADRIEAAAKREREAGAEAAQICGEIGEMVGREADCHQPVTDCHGLNAAAMREACANIAEYAKTAACHTEDAHLLGYLNQIERWAEAALSAPKRNCDVGTSDEQSARFDAHCRKHMGCLTCPLREKDGGVPKHCEFAWAQMPYEEEKE